ncbi:hypothetical protein [Gordonia sputi]|uniref:hypothetical protein n=1 Tax=Gordonia sputi TaxID=36823 RepID=UPI00227124D9|nr:hypothetical protein [Gordonia sputi]
MTPLTTPTGSYKAINPEKILEHVSAIATTSPRDRAPPAYFTPDLDASRPDRQQRLSRGGSFIATKYLNAKTVSAGNRLGQSLLAHPEDSTLFGHMVAGHFDGETETFDVTLWSPLPNLLALAEAVKGAALVIPPHTSWVQRAKGTSAGYQGLYLHRMAIPARAIADTTTDADPLSTLPDDQRAAITAAAQAQAKADAEQGILATPTALATLADLRTKLITAIDSALIPTTTPETSSDQDVFDLDDFDSEDGDQ